MLARKMHKSGKIDLGMAKIWQPSEHESDMPLILAKIWQPSEHEPDIPLILCRCVLHFGAHIFLLFEH